MSIPRLDSREGPVQLDYDELVISTPTVFTKTVDFSSTTAPITGFTWPRGIETQWQATNYNAGDVIDPWISPTFSTSNYGADTFDFLVLPQLNQTNYFNISPTTGISTVLTEGYYYINALFRNNFPLPQGGEVNAAIWYKNQNSDSWSTLACTGVPFYNIPGPFPANSSISCSNMKYLPAGGTIKTAFYSAQGGSVTLFLTLIKLR